MKPVLALLIAVLWPGGIFAASSATFNPHDFGATGDGKTKDTAALQRAIDAAGKSGGTVLLDRGCFLSGTLHMKSGVTLRIEPGATLLGSTEHADYQKNRWLALLEAKNVHDITIAGGGVIDGQGERLAADVVRLMLARKLDDPPDSKRPGEKNRPQIIEFVDCERVTLKDITLKNSSCWVETYMKSENVTLDHVTVRSTAYWNNDGLDLMDCHHATVIHCDIDSADDGLCLKSGEGKACEDIRIEDCAVRSSASAFKLGTTSHGAFRRITVQGLRVHDTFRSAIALESVDGAAMEDIDVGNVTALNTGNAIFIRLGNRVKGGKPGSISHVRIHDVKVQIPATAPDVGYPMAGPAVKAPHNLIPSSITGLPGHLVTDVSLKNIIVVTAAGGKNEVAEAPLDQLSKIPEQADRYPEFSMFGELAAWGFYVRHAKNITFENVDLRALTPDFRPAYVFDDVQSSTLSGPLISPASDGTAVVIHNARDVNLIAPAQGPKPVVREIP